MKIQKGAEVTPKFPTLVNYGRVGKVIQITESSRRTFAVEFTDDEIEVYWEDELVINCPGIQGFEVNHIVIDDIEVENG